MGHMWVDLPLHTMHYFLWKALIQATAIPAPHLIDTAPPDVVLVVRVVLQPQRLDAAEKLLPGVVEAARDEPGLRSVQATFAMNITPRGPVSSQPASADQKFSAACDRTEKLPSARGQRLLCVRQCCSGNCTAWRIGRQARKPPLTGTRSCASKHPRPEVAICSDTRYN